MIGIALMNVRFYFMDDPLLRSFAIFLTCFNLFLKQERPQRKITCISSYNITKRGSRSKAEDSDCCLQQVHIAHIHAIFSCCLFSPYPPFIHTSQALQNPTQAAKCIWAAILYVLLKCASLRYCQIVLNQQKKNKKPRLSLYSPILDVQCDTLFF